MKRFWFFGTVLLAVLVYFTWACAPKSPTSAPASPAATPAAPITRPQETAWDKVIAAAKQEGKVNLYTWRFGGDIGKAVAEAFEKTYGIKLETITGVGAVLTERIASEQAAGKNMADTLDTAISNVALAKGRGLTQAWGELPMAAEKGIWQLPPIADAEGHMVIFGPVRHTVYINTTRVKPGEEPRSLKELLDPKWGGKKVVTASPLTDPTIIYWYVVKIVNDDFFVRLAKNGLWVAPTNKDAISILSRGEAALAFPQTETLTAPVVAEGAPVRAIEVAEGAVGAPSVTMAIIKNAPHPNAARLFANWIISKEGQTALHKAAFTAPLRKDVPNFLPQGVNIDFKKVTMLGLKELDEVARLQREGTIAKLMGVDK